jgi:photosystem II stability/assembly factor-like uncharacterized protein
MRGRVRPRLLGGLGICAGLLAVKVGIAQGPPPQAPPPPPVNQSTDPLLKSFVWRSIGPASMGGRIDDIAAVESNPSVFYIGFATGGVFKTTNNGTTWTPIFDTYPTASIGDIAIAPSDPNIVWVGTGEPNNRQSSSWGDGVYKSTDAGKTFTNVGLKETHNIARIVVHPKDPNIVYVAAIGQLFGPNPERGVFKTTDGGKTWATVKAIDADTGATDLVMHPANPNVLFAAFYQRRRTPWGFNGGGPGSGIWKTADAGKTWTEVRGNGLPEGLVLGRIGLDICRAKPNVMYAQLEVGPSAGSGFSEPQAQTPTAAQPAGQPPALAAAPQRGQAAPGAPGAQAAGGGQRGGGRGGEPSGPPDPKRSGVWRSDDGGKTWRVASNNNNRPMYYSQIRVDPNNPDTVYTMGATFYKSTDGGKTFRNVAGIAHGDHHALWIDSRNSSHLILGNDGGLDVSYDQGDTWEFVNTIAVGQFYAISADMRKPYWVCGGLQDNGSWCGPSATRSRNGITNADWFRIGGGDGFYTQQDPTDWTVIYAESQDGNVQRLDLRTGGSAPIRPIGRQAQRGGGAGGGAAQQQLAALAQQMGMGGRGGQPNVVPMPPEGTPPFRYYWNTPVLLSPHNPRVVYVGGDRLFKSYNQGATWTYTPDLTKNIDRTKREIMGVALDKPMASKNDGVASYSHIVTLAESPVMPGILWVGTNDGNLQVSRDGGATWKNVVDNVAGVPKETHVSRVEASHFDAGTCYASFDNHRVADVKPYVFVTRDYGQTWQSIAANLPAHGNVNVIREDPKNKDLLYLGTEFGFFISRNGGAEWKPFMTGLPVVRIDDILVHPRDNDLIVGTHGRSIYVIDDISPLQQLTAEAAKADAFVFEPKPGTIWSNDITRAFNLGASKHFRGENPTPGTAISYYLKTAPAGDVKIEISDYTGKVVRTMTGPKEVGLNRVMWNMRGDPPQLPAAVQQQMQQFGGRGGGRGGVQAGLPFAPGVYAVKVTIGGKEFTTKVQVEADAPLY